MRAIVRPPGDSFVRALSSHPAASTIDPERARSQHERYRRTLREIGVEVIELPPDELPDSCFVEDCVVVVGSAAMLTRPGAPSRRPEVEAVGTVLAGLVDRLSAMSAPATLDGGDVVHLGQTLVVGRSVRTNDDGIEQLAAFVLPESRAVIRAEVPDGTLHLQSAVTSLSTDAVIGDPAVLEHPPFADVPHRISVPDDETQARNVLAIARDVVMPAGCSLTAGAVADLGYRVHEVDLSEFHKADGGTTCLSVLVG
jgi:dimethylargininase